MTLPTSDLQPGQPANRRSKKEAVNVILDWFTEQGWTPFRFQRQTWSAHRDGLSGLVHATTGTGKTYAAWMGPLIQWLESQTSQPAMPKGKRRLEIPLQVLWLTPLRALAADTLQALEKPIRDLKIPWTVEGRTSDSSSSIRSRQSRRLPSALVTTPESLSLLLTRSDAAQQFSELRTVIVDEWHELLSTKRGVQTELCLARLRRWHPHLQIWGLSATIGNTQQAMQILLGSPQPELVDAPEVLTMKTSSTSILQSGCDSLSPIDSSQCPPEQESTPSTIAKASATAVSRTKSNSSPARKSAPPTGLLIQGAQKKRILIDSLIPDTLERFPWAGHLGLKLLEDVAGAVNEADTSLVFTNTRSQTEAWYQGILKCRPDWAGRIALHHGSLDRDKREWVENSIRDGKLKCVVCTSTLDLGVDFSPVDRVFQIGSPKGVARLLQRAGRSGHSPGESSRVTCVPTHALELLEIAAARDAIAAHRLETRNPPLQPMDLLVQHTTSMALGEGFLADELFQEVRTSCSYSNLARADFDWIIRFVSTGGEALRAYPEYSKIRLGADGRYRLEDRRMSLQHRLSIGTIASDLSLTVQYLKGPKLGTIEEGFLAKLTPGDCFIFAGHPVELVQVRDSKVWVRRAKNSTSIRMPRWMGGRMPLSTTLADSIRIRLDQAGDGIFRDPELRALEPLFELQSRWSRIPRQGDLLIERTQSREGYHLFIYPFAGRLVHEGIAALLAYRMSKLTPITFSISVNDYGFQLLSSCPPPFVSAMQAGLLTTDKLDEEIADCMNSVEMAKRQFREVASIAGLIFKGFPGKRKTAGQLQASSGLLFDVFSNYDPQNLLLRQTRQEVLETQLERNRLVQTLTEMSQARLTVLDLPRFSPLCFPLLVERMRERLSSEKLADRVLRMQKSLELAANKRPR